MELADAHADAWRLFPSAPEGHDALVSKHVGPTLSPRKCGIYGAELLPLQDCTPRSQSSPLGPEMFEHSTRDRDVASDGFASIPFKSDIAFDESFLLGELVVDAEPVPSSADELASMSSSSRERLLSSKPRKGAHTPTFQDKVRSTTVPADEVGLSPLELRRKRNREAMQRARQRQRDSVEHMKVIVQRLQAQFERLSAEKQRQFGRLTSYAAAAPHLTGLRSHDHIEAQYHALAEASRRLKEEKYALELMLTERIKTMHRLRQTVVDRKDELHLPSPRSAEAWQSVWASFEFIPVTERVADDAIKRCYEELVRLEKLSRPLGPSGDAPTSTFGWQIMCHVLPSRGYFMCFSKWFDGVSAEEIMIRSWSTYSRPEYNACDSRQGANRLVVLQELNDSAYVIARDAPHPTALGKILRTIVLRFRLQTERGSFVIGRACLNPTNPDLRLLDEREINVVYGDFNSWIEFVPRPSAVGCEVKFGAVCDFDTQEDMQLRLVNALMTTIAWETSLLGPPFKLNLSVD
ncbi:hypothetical protein P43SY_001177 [Pythium insidiosum]|uniref:BZIP domain-containing protein n=1 Tax=Pythium insidiosum TaxID=114742 RepID=A0AAD5Q519_PYTIN|nr:hypothetical protein P43SY_001177 [Pythium insidiosum]